MKEEQQQEDRIQQFCVLHYNNTYCRLINDDGTPNELRSLIYHVPNQHQQHLTSIGVLGGVSDLVIYHRATYTHTALLMHVEVKAAIGKQSPKQMQFEARVRSLGYEYYIVRTLEEFKELIERIHNKELLSPSTMPIY